MKNFIIFGIVVFLTLFTANDVYASHDSSAPPCYHDNVIIDYYYSNNRSNIIWQVGYYLTSSLGERDEKKHISRTWKIDINNTSGSYGNRWERPPTIQINNTTSEIRNVDGPYAITWSTACVDPRVRADYNPEPRSCNDWYYTGAINITASSSNSNGIFTNAAEDRYSNSGGGTLRFLGWGDNSNCPREPSCNPDSCADRGITCGSYTSCGNTYRCTSGCRSCDGKVCKKTGCNPNNAGCYGSGNDNCSGDCTGSIKGMTWIDGKDNLKQEDGKWDNGEGYSDPTVQRGTWKNNPRRFDLAEQRKDRSDKDYSFGDLTTGSTHDIRVTEYNKGRLNVDENKDDVRVKAGGTEINFKFNYKKSAIKGQVIWDEDGNLGTTGDQRPYNRRTRIRIYYPNGTNADRNDVSDRDNGRYSIGGNATNLDDEGRKWLARLIVNDRDYSLPNGHMMVDGDNEAAVFIKGVDETNVNFYVTDLVQYPNFPGRIFLDNPSAGTQGAIDASDTRYTASQGRIDLNPGNRYGLTTKNRSNNTGNFLIENVSAGTYTAVLEPASIRNGYTILIGTRTGITSTEDGPNPPSIDFLVRQGSIPTFDISGGIFMDADNGHDKDDTPAEDYLTNWASETVTLTQGGNPVSGHPPITGPNPSDGTYSFGSLLAGDYAVTLTRTRTTHMRNYPQAQNAYTIHVGIPGCSSSPFGTCTAGDVDEVDFGLYPRDVDEAWIQGIGGDMRSDQNYNVTIPSGQYMSIAQGVNASPGIIFNFDVNGSFSTKGWHVDDSGYGGKSVKTSYASVNAALNRGGINITDFFSEEGSPCTGTAPNCSLPADREEGAYKYTGNVTLTAVNGSFVSGRDYIFLVKGNLTINGNITVPPGATAMFVASGNIIVNGVVTNIEGIYSADLDFIVNNNASSTPLTIEGSVIANAVKNSSNTNPFQSTRDLGLSNSTTPAVKFIYRPDFVLNAPNFIRGSNYNFTEVAPPGTKP